MCLIIVQPKGGTIPVEHMRTGFVGNSDGAGYMFYAKRSVQIRKGFFTFDEFYMAFARDRKRYPSSAFVVHFRMGTSGKMDKDNCHPFYSDTHEIGIAHNGVLSDYAYPNSDKSDTAHFIDAVIDTLPTGFLGNIGIMELLERFCKMEFSKLAIMDNKGGVHIVNKSAGEMDDGGIWYSNKGYQKNTIALWGQDTDRCECCEREFPWRSLIDGGDLLLCEDCYQLFYPGNAVLQTAETD